MMERRKKIALELSDLVIYCRPVPFDEDSKTSNTFQIQTYRCLVESDSPAHVISCPKQGYYR